MFAGCKDSEKCLSPKQDFVKIDLMPSVLLINQEGWVQCTGPVLAAIEALPKKSELGLVLQHACRAWTGHGFNAEIQHFLKLSECISCCWPPASLDEEQSCSDFPASVGRVWPGRSGWWCSTGDLLVRLPLQGWLYHWENADRI